MPHVFSELEISTESARNMHKTVDRAAGACSFGEIPLFEVLHDMLLYILE